MNGEAVTSYHAERQVADALIKDALRHATKKGRLNSESYHRYISKFTILIYRGNNYDCPPCKECADYLKAKGFKHVMCYMKGNFVKLRLDEYETNHLSWSQLRKIKMDGHKIDEKYYEYRTLRREKAN